jgi:predicted nucleotidyltransferase component of viral defense system
MIEKTALQQYAVKQQTKFLNVVREYCQHRYLSIFYRQKGSEAYLFKGGTALKIVFRSPRYSEDLDFTAVKNSHQFENILQDVLIELEKEGVPTQLIESKPTSGGHLAMIQPAVYDMRFFLKIEISFRELSVEAGERVAVAPDYLPGYVVQILATSLLISEKLHALLTRKKPRDFFDLYYILRANLLPVSERSALGKVIALIPQKPEFFAKELTEFLPSSFHGLLKDFPRLLAAEVERFL